MKLQRIKELIEANKPFLLIKSYCTPLLSTEKWPEYETVTPREFPKLRSDTVCDLIGNKVTQQDFFEILRTEPLEMVVSSEDGDIYRFGEFDKALMKIETHRVRHTRRSV